MGNKLHKNSEGLGRPVLILILIVSALLVGAVGYVLGSSNAEEDAKEKNEQQIADLQTQVDAAKTGAADKLEEGQEEVAEGQQTLETLQAENAELKETIDDQEQKIADLEAELEEAQTDTTTPEQ